MGIGKVVGIGAVVVLAGAVYLGMASNSYIKPYNDAVESVSQVQNVYNARWDKLTPLGQTVERYAQHEQGTFVGTAQGRGGGSAAVTGVAPPKRPDALKKSPEELLKHPELQDQMASANNGIITYVNAAQEAYPDLKANKLFEDLMTEISGSTNRITVERKRMNAAIKEYNMQISHFPGMIVAHLTGYTKLPYYEAKAGQDESPNLFQK